MIIRFLALIGVLCFLPCIAPAQLLYQTGFPEQAGTQLAGQDGWTATGPGIGPIVSAGSLSMSGFAASSGNSIAITPGPASTVGQAIPAQEANPSTNTDVWMSFMITVNSITSRTDTPLIGFVDSNGNEVGDISLAATPTGFGIGGSVTSTSPVGLNADGTGWDVCSTFLVVEQFSMEPTGYDVLNAWIDQDGSVVANWGTAPLGAAIQQGEYNYTPAITGIFISSDPNSADVTLDEIRVGTSWADVTPVGPLILPVVPTVPDAGGTVLLLALSIGLCFSMKLLRIGVMAG